MVTARASTAAAIALTMVTACDRDGEDEVSRAAQVYVAAVRSVAAEMPLEDPDELPIVYVVSSGDRPIRGDVQAEVASALNDDVDVLFADHRDEALDMRKPNEPVRDGGRLLAIEPLDEPDDETIDLVELEVEVYRSEAEWSRRLVTFERSNEAWSVTSSSELEVGEIDESGESGDVDESGEADDTVSASVTTSSSP